MAAPRTVGVFSARGIPRRGRSHASYGFTLVELLVVITIIGMLMALLLPAIQSAREAGRRNTCANNVRQCAIAMANFHDGKKYFPGYANVVGNKRASWVVVLLPYFERSDLYSMWVNNANTYSLPAMVTMQGATLNNSSGPVGQNPWAHSLLNILVCPSNPNTDSSPSANPLSFVVNTGSANTASDLQDVDTAADWYEDVNSGIFFNNARGDYVASTQVPYPASALPGGGPRSTIDFISTNDGSSNTLMLAENLQAMTWATDPTASPAQPFLSEFQIRQSTGFVWFVTGNKNNLDPPAMSYAGNTNWTANRINAQAKAVANPIPLNYGSGTGGLVYARPSSAHPGGVNTIFCDGHLRFISEDIPYHVYTQLMTPRQNPVQLTWPAPAITPQTWANGMGNDPWNYTLNEADY